MSDSPAAKIVGLALLILYPLLIYFGLKYFDPRWVSGAMFLLLGWKLLDRRAPRKSTLGFAAALLLATALTLYTGSDYGLLLYPVLVNFFLLVIFMNSYLNPPSIIETIARLREPELPPQAVAYTRKVTLAWCAFFLLNGAISAFTLTLEREYWVLYNGCIAYLLMGALFLGEFILRQRVKEKHRA